MLYSPLGIVSNSYKIFPADYILERIPRSSYIFDTHNRCYFLDLRRALIMLDAGVRQNMSDEDVIELYIRRARKMSMQPLRKVPSYYIDPSIGFAIQYESTPFEIRLLFPGWIRGKPRDQRDIQI